MSRFVLCVFSIAVVVSTAVPEAQFFERLSNPLVPTVLTHPPGLGIQVTKVAFGPSTGEGVQELVDALTSRFVQRGIEVLEREHLVTLLREHDFNLTEYVDQAAVASIGKIVGPSVMVFVNVQRRSVEKKPLREDWRDRDNYVHRTYISRTSVMLRASIRSVDLATARIFAATTVESSPSLENRVDDRCCPEFPSELQLADVAVQDAVEQAARLFAPWTETVSLVYYDDKDCGLKSAHGLHKGGDIAGALRQSLANVEQCKAMPSGKAKVLARAYHNVGIGYFSQGEYGKAIEALEEAQRIRPASIHVEAIAACRKAEALDSDMRRIEESAVLSRESVEDAAKAKRASQEMTNDDVVALVDASLPPEIVLSKIKTAQCRFDTRTEALIKLKEAKVPDPVIVAMLECKAK